MIYKWFTILVLLTLCSFVSYSQVNDAKETLNVSERQSEKQKYVKEQAILLLKTNLLGSKSIKNFRQRTDVIAEASATLWNYDILLTNRLPIIKNYYQKKIKRQRKTPHYKI
jgi:hypothetical protein